jgi:hypothetical protein
LKIKISIPSGAIKSGGQNVHRSNTAVNMVGLGVFYWFSHHSTKISFALFIMSLTASLQAGVKGTSNKPL